MSGVTTQREQKATSHGCKTTIGSWQRTQAEFYFVHTIFSTMSVSTHFHSLYHRIGVSCSRCHCSHSHAIFLLSLSPCVWKYFDRICTRCGALPLHKIVHLFFYSFQFVASFRSQHVSLRFSFGVYFILQYILATTRREQHMNRQMKMEIVTARVHFLFLSLIYRWLIRAELIRPYVCMDAHSIIIKIACLCCRSMWVSMLRVLYCACWIETNRRSFSARAFTFAHTNNIHFFHTHFSPMESHFSACIHATIRTHNIPGPI